jgi:hypothetical protein
MYGVSIESPIESPVVSSTPLTHQVVEYRIDLTEGTYTLLKPTIYPGSNDLVQHARARTHKSFKLKAVVPKGFWGARADHFA